MKNQKFDFQFLLDISSFSIYGFVASPSKMRVLDLPFKQSERR